MHPTSWRIDEVVDERYRVVDVIRTGGMGLVYRLHHLAWGIDLAAKVPRRFPAGEREVMRRFEAEADRWIRIGAHPHCVNCVYVRRFEAIPCVFAEWVDGGSLTEQIASRSLYSSDPLATLGRLLDVAVQAAWGLGHAHRNGLVHQDVKPANLMVAPDGTVKVTDFGLAKARADFDLETADPTVSFGGCTPAYCSPEQAKAAAGSGRELADATDVWSWALSLLEMFVGERPVDAGPAAPAALDELLEYGPADERIPAMPAAVVDMLRQCFEPDPDRRPADMDELARVLIDEYADRLGTAYPRRQLDSGRLLADQLSNQALSYLDLGDPQHAEQRWDEAIQIDPHHPHAVYNRGLYRWREGLMRDDDLIAQIEELRGTHEDDWIDEYQLGLVHLERGDLGAAVTVLSEAASARGTVHDVESALATAVRTPRPRPDQVLRGHDAAVEAVAFSGDLRRAVSGSALHAIPERPTEGGTARVWDLASGEEIAGFRVDPMVVNDVALNHDGTVVVAAGKSGAGAWDADSGRERCRFEGHTDTVRGVAVRPDGRIAASSDLRGAVLLWDTRTGHVVRELSGPHHSSCFSRQLAFTADGRLLVCWQESISRVRVWEVDTGFPTQTIPTPGARVELSVDGRTALSYLSYYRMENEVEIWDIATADLTARYHPRLAMGEHRSVNADGRVAVTADDKLTLWNARTGRCRRTFTYPSGVTATQLSPDGKCGIVGCADGTVRVVDLDVPEVRAPASYAHPRTTTDLAEQTALVARTVRRAEEERRSGAWASVGELVGAARRLPGLAREPDLLRLWIAASRHGRRTGLLGAWSARTMHEATGAHWSLSGDGRFALCRQYDSVEVVDAASGAWLHSLDRHGNQVYSVAVASDSTLAVTGSEDRVVRIWDLESGELLRSLHGHERTVNSVAISANGSTVASCSSDQCIILWDLSTGEPRHVFADPDGQPSDVRLTPDGSVLYTLMGDGACNLWDTRSGSSLAALGGTGQAAVSENGRHVLVSAPAGGLTVWNLEQGWYERLLTGHTGTVNAVAISDDGTTGFSASADGTIRVWGLGGGGCRQTIEAHEGEVTALEVLGEGRFAFSAGADAAVRIWDLSREQCLRAIAFPGIERPRFTSGDDGRLLMVSALSGGPAQLWNVDWNVDFTGSIE